MPDPVVPPLPRDFLKTSVLLLLLEQPAHGYELLARLRLLGFPSSDRDARYADPGAVYRILRALERERLVHSAWSPTGRRRRLYELTRAGREELHRRSLALVGASDAIGAFLGRYEEFVAVGARRAGHGGAHDPPCE